MRMVKVDPAQLGAAMARIKSVLSRMRGAGVQKTAGKEILAALYRRK